MITNIHNVPLGLAVWAVHDEYDYINESNYISVTGLMKPTRQIVLAPRVPEMLKATPDVVDYIARALGHTIHDAVEKSWVKGYATNLKKLGYPQSAIDRVRINPTKAELLAAMDPIPVYLEQRGFRKIVVDGVEYTIGGKFDLVAEGILHDVKSTSAFGFMMGTRDDEYILQGSLYRWIHRDIITEGFIRICFLFTDWQKFQAKTNPKYPQQRVTHKEYKLWSLEETEQWIIKKIREIAKAHEAEDHEIPECTPDELWMSEPKYKYFANAAKTDGRSTKNFDDAGEAMSYWKKDKGGAGVVITTPGTPKRCEEYCGAFPVCKQREKYFQ